MSKHTNKLEQFKEWHNGTIAGALTGMLIEGALAYGFASWSIDSGSLFLYAITLLLMLGVVRNSINLIKILVRGKAKK